MPLNASINRHTNHAATPFPHKGPGPEEAEDDAGVALPVNPDQGTPLMPDEDGEAKAPT